MGPTPTDANIGPGLGAFIVFFVLAVALFFLMKNMNGRMRRMSYRERERLAREDSASEGRDTTP